MGTEREMVPIWEAPGEAQGNFKRMRLAVRPIVRFLRFQQFRFYLPL